jgi:putative endonuclease
MKLFTSETQKIGEIGEEIACKYLKNKGFTVFERNFTKKAGEIDIVANKDGELHFFEVKSVSRENNVSIETYAQVSRETFRPEENMTFHKMRKLSRITQIFLAKHKEFADMDFYWNILAIELNQKTRMARVRMIEKVNITE